MCVHCSPATYLVQWHLSIQLMCFWYQINLQHIYSPMFPFTSFTPPFLPEKEWTGVNSHGREKTNCSLWLSPVLQTTCWSLFWERIAPCDSFTAVMFFNLRYNSLNCLHLGTARNQYCSFYREWKYRLTIELEGFLLYSAAVSRLTYFRSVCLSDCFLWKTGCF